MRNTLSDVWFDVVVVAIVVCVTYLVDQNKTLPLAVEIAFAVCMGVLLGVAIGNITTKYTYYIGEREESRNLFEYMM